MALRARHRCKWYRPELGGDAAFLVSDRNGMTDVWFEGGFSTRDEAEEKATRALKSERACLSLTYPSSPALASQQRARRAIALPDSQPNPARDLQD